MTNPRYHRWRRAALRITPLLLWLCTMAACMPSAKGLSETLAFQAMKFNSGVRWRKHQEASKLLHPKIRDRYLTQAEGVDETLRVSEIELLRSNIDAKGRLAVMRYRYRWHHLNQGVVRSTIVAQHWKQHKGDWYIRRISRAAGAKFPLFEGLAEDAKRPRPRVAPRTRPAPPERRPVPPPR
ncbi:MAG: hypothetical protein ABI333_03670 [bacterium]